MIHFLTIKLSCLIKLLYCIQNLQDHDCVIHKTFSHNTHASFIVQHPSQHNSILHSTTASFTAQQHPSQHNSILHSTTASFTAQQHPSQHNSILHSTTASFTAQQHPSQHNNPRQHILTQQSICNKHAPKSVHMYKHVACTCTYQQHIQTNKQTKLDSQKPVTREWVLAKKRTSDAIGSLCHQHAYMPNHVEEVKGKRTPQQSNAKHQVHLSFYSHTSIR